MTSHKECENPFGLCELSSCHQSSCPFYGTPYVGTVVRVEKLVYEQNKQNNLYKSVNLILGDALVELPKLEKNFSLVIFDPPAELSFEDCVKCLRASCRPHNQSLAFYGVNPSRIARRMSAANVPMETLTPIFLECTGEIVGYVGGHSLKAPKAIYVSTHKGSNSHPTSKSTEWYEEICENFAYGNRSILDPFAGEGAVGALCLAYGIDYTGIELDPRYFEILQRRLAY